MALVARARRTEVNVSALVSLFLDVTLSLSNLSFAKVRRYTLVDGLHTIPELTIEVLCDDPALDLSAMVGERAVAFLDEPHFPRFDGIVRAVEQRSADPTGASCYVLTLAPSLWLTTERSGQHIFRDRTVLEIAADVAARYGHRVAPPELRLSRAAQDWPKYDYRVQYGETDRDFLFRILADDGLVSYWAPSAEDPQALVWTLTDDTSIGAPALDVPYRPPSNALTELGPHVRSVRTSARLASSAVNLRDHDYQNPALALECRSIAADVVGAEQPLVRYGYAVGEYRDDAGGLALAAIRLQAARARALVYRWETSFSVPAGTIVRLFDHPREDANGDFLVVSMRTEVEGTRRTHVAELVPAAFAWRPERLEKPRIHGTQTARVVGPAGKEIDVDEQGRIEVEFRWDTRDLHGPGASRRVRVAMPWMGAGRGFWTLPRVGDEVVIAYLDGDPDQPLVVGSVNNAVAPPAASLPASQTQSWWKSKSTPDGEGYNAIFMEDLKGSELLALYAERDFFSHTGRRSATFVGENAILNVAGSQSTAVGGGQSGTVGGDFNMSVTGAYYLDNAGMVVVSSQAIDMSAAATFSISSGGERVDKAAIKHHIESPAIFLHGKDGVQVVTQKFHVHAGTEVVLQVGGSSLKMTADCIELSSPMIKLNP